MHLGTVPFCTLSRAADDAAPNPGVAFDLLSRETDRFKVPERGVPLFSAELPDLLERPVAKELSNDGRGVHVGHVGSEALP